MQKRAVIITIILIIAGLLGYYSYQKISGLAISDYSSGSSPERIKLVSEIKERAYRDSAQCSDSDGGVYMGTSGKVISKLSKQANEFSDKCSPDGRILTEYYCSGKNVKIIRGLCNNGCVDDKCLANEKKQCFLEISINEKNSGESAVFSLNGVKNIYGDYAHLIRQYYEGEESYAILEAYGDSNKLLGRYDLPSSRFSIAEDFGDDPKGEIIEINEASTEILIPYSPELKYVAIRFGDKLQKMALKAEDVKCVRACRAEGEEGAWGNDSCCETLIPEFKPSKLGDKQMFVCKK